MTWSNKISGPSFKVDEERAALAVLITAESTTPEDLHRVAIEYRQDALICWIIAMARNTSAETLEWLYENHEDPYGITSINVRDTILRHRNCPEGLKLRAALES